MFTDNQTLILAILAEDPAKELHLQELGRLLGKKPGVFQRGLNSLEEQGWVISRRQGNLRLFRINDRHPLFEEVRSVARKTAGIEAQLKKVVCGLPSVTLAFIYGSYAADTMRPDSDVDLLVVARGSDVEDDLVAGLASLEKTLGREVNYKFYTERVFKDRRRAKDPFLKEVLSAKHILLKGAL